MVHAFAPVKWKSEVGRHSICRWPVQKKPGDHDYVGSYVIEVISMIYY